MQPLSIQLQLLDRRKTFGTWLRDCRKKAKITQSELAKTLGYDSSQLISNIERGVSLLPSKRIPEFAQALGCSLLELEVRYFQCSARNNSEGRMPDLLIKYLPLIEVLEFGRGNREEAFAAIEAIEQLHKTTPLTTGVGGSGNQASIHPHDDPGATAMSASAS